MKFKTENLEVTVFDENDNEVATGRCDLDWEIEFDVRDWGIKDVFPCGFVIKNLQVFDDNFEPYTLTILDGFNLNYEDFENITCVPEKIQITTFKNHGKVFFE